jgi:drug/metabolite transporter (DMT)-like permease
LLGLGYAIFVAMVFCHTAYFKLISLLPAHVAAMGVLAVPVVGVISSAWILGEIVGVSELIALLLVVSSLCLLISKA